MNRKALIFVALVMVVAMTVSGCSSVPKKTKEELAGIKSRVDTLETRVEEVETKQAYVDRNAQEQAMAVQEMRSVQMPNSNISTRSKDSKTNARMKDIQACLKNAGFYDGPVDGVKGRKTRKAIKDFQGANGLVADGLVGNKTWEALSKYAAAPGKSGEEAIK